MDSKIDNKRLKWRDFGPIPHPIGIAPWAATHAYVPTPLLLSDRVRVFVSHWDPDKIGRIGFIDLSRDDPTKVFGIAQHPCLDVGAQGEFDEHGVTPLSASRLPDGTVRLYYCGWQRSSDPSVRYTLFIGAAISFDDGQTFNRISRAPILGPSRTTCKVRAGASFYQASDGRWQGWYCEQRGSLIVQNRTVPSYDLVRTESSDGLIWPTRGEVLLSAHPPQLIGFCRPVLWRWNGELGLMTALRYGDDGRYKRLVCLPFDKYGALSIDRVALEVNPEETVDQQRELSFPALVPTTGGYWVLYNGDDFGRWGLRLARIDF